MNANMFTTSHMFTDVVGNKSKGELPHPPIQALKEGSVGRTTSDLQNMMEDERKRHMDQYKYAHGHNDGSAPLGEPSF